MRKYKNLSKQKMAEKEKELAAAIAEITAELEAMQVTFTYIHTYFQIIFLQYVCHKYKTNLCMYECMYVQFVCVNVCMYVCVNVCMNVCAYSSLA